jgi:hypothetical protein
MSVPEASSVIKTSKSPCSVKDKRGVVRHGKCMFVWECMRSEGVNLGICSDRIIFGSCCAHDPAANSIHQPGPAGSFGGSNDGGVGGHQKLKPTDYLSVLANSNKDRLPSSSSTSSSLAPGSPVFQQAATPSTTVSTRKIQEKKKKKKGENIHRRS